jgi:hypothetical protein
VAVIVATLATAMWLVWFVIDGERTLYARAVLFGALAIVFYARLRKQRWS